MQREGTKLQRRIMSKEGWTEHTFNKVDWDSHEIAFRKLGRSRFRTRVVQFEHRWLPMGKQLHRINIFAYIGVSLPLDKNTTIFSSSSRSVFCRVVLVRLDS